MAKQLLIESVIVDGSLFKEIPTKITESNISGQRVGILRTIQGPQGVIDTPTGNNRTYPQSEILRAIEVLKPKMESRIVTGQADHPTSTPSIKDVSHLVTKLWVENFNGIKYLMGEWEILDTINGRTLDTLYKAGSGVGASFRGFGNVSESDGVVSDYDMVTIDAVCDPSASTYISEKTFKSSPTNESKEEMKESLEQKIEALTKMVESIKVDQAKKEILEAKEVNEMKVTAKKDLTVNDKTIKTGEEIPADLIATLKKDEDYTVTEANEPKEITKEEEKDLEQKIGHKMFQKDWADLSDEEKSKVKDKMKEHYTLKETKEIDMENVELEKKLKIESAKVKSLVSKLNALREYTLKAEKVGDIVAEELRKVVGNNEYNTKAVSELKKYAVALESTVDGSIADFIKTTVTSLEEMTEYAIKLEKTIDEELVPYTKKLETTIDNELVPYATKVENTLAEVIEQVKSGKIYESVSLEHQGLVEKAILTYPALSPFKEELLQTRDSVHLEERMHKYLVVFANRGSSNEMRMQSKYVGQTKLVKESNDRSSELIGRMDSLYGNDSGLE